MDDFCSYFNCFKPNFFTCHTSADLRWSYLVLWGQKRARWGSTHLHRSTAVAGFIQHWPAVRSVIEAVWWLLWRGSRFESECVGGGTAADFILRLLTVSEEEVWFSRSSTFLWFPQSNRNVKDFHFGEQKRSERCQDKELSNTLNIWAV